MADAESALNEARQECNKRCHIIHTATENRVKIQDVIVSTSLETKVKQNKRQRSVAMVFLEFECFLIVLSQKKGVWPLPPPHHLFPSPTPTPITSTAGMVGHHNRNVNLRDADTRYHHTSHLFSVAGRQGCRGRSLLTRMVEFSLLPVTRGNTIEHTRRVETASHTSTAFTHNSTIFHQFSSLYLK